MTGAAPLRPGRSRAAALFRVFFVVYAVALVVATHWPRLVVHGPVSRTDLVLHFLAFGVWSALLHLSGMAGAAGTGRALRNTVLVGLVYTALDEGSQALPFVERTFDVLDLAADAGGVVVGASAACAVARRARA